MPIKRGLLPKKHIVIRDLKRGIVEIETDQSYNLTLQNALINEKHHKDLNPNHPLETDTVHAWDVKKLRWVEFKISELEFYRPPHMGATRDQTDQEGTTPTTGARGTRHRTSEGIQTSEETQTDDRGTEAEGQRESGESTGRTWSSKK